MAENVTATVAAAGINKSHGASLCLVDGKCQPLFCASGEPFTRIKLQRGMPGRSTPTLHATTTSTGLLSRLPGLIRRVASCAEPIRIPSLINTNFNMHEEPIICTPREAVRAFLAAKLDALAFGDYLVVNDSPEASHDTRAAAASA